VGPCDHAIFLSILYSCPLLYLNFPPPLFRWFIMVFPFCLSLLSNGLSFPFFWMCWLYGFCKGEGSPLKRAFSFSRVPFPSEPLPPSVLLFGSFLFKHRLGDRGFFRFSFPGRFMPLDSPPLPSYFCDRWCQSQEGSFFFVVPCIMFFQSTQTFWAFPLAVTSVGQWRWLRRSTSLCLTPRFPAFGSMESCVVGTLNL